MIGFRKSLIVCFMVASALLMFPIKTSAYEVSAAGGCSVPNVHPDGRGFYYKVKSFPDWQGLYYANDYYCKERQYKRED